MMLGALALVASAFSAQTAAAAERAYITSSVNLRTGPDAGYPRIVTLSSGENVQVFGCVNDWSWCDVATRYERGWVSSSYLDYDDGGRRTRIYGNGPRLGLPILTFVLGTYWDAHYRDRSWYGQRSQWERQPPQRPRQNTAPRNANPRAQQGRAPSAPINRAPSAGGRGNDQSHDRGNTAPQQPSRQSKPSGGQPQPQQRGGKPSSGQPHGKQQDDQPRR